MNILAFETSCDETSVALVQDGRKLLSNVVSSQIKAHREFGGVVPELASRMHTEIIHKLIRIALEKAGLIFKQVDACAITYGPGLEGALLIGLVAAKTTARLLDIPLIGVNHLHGHIYAHFLTDDPPPFPFVTLVVSGGHTLLVLVKAHFEFELLGTTRDDAAGEAFDKVARFMGLGYPGGPQVELQAREGDASLHKFPKGMLKIGFEFSFSGLKTAVIQSTQKIAKQGTEIPVADICAGFQKSVIDTLIYKSLKACKQYSVPHLVLSGGVTANQALRSEFETACAEANVRLYVPPFDLCTDNAAMIGAAAYFDYMRSPHSDTDLSVKPNLPICN